jgi:hypothetical protein
LPRDNYIFSLIHVTCPAHLFLLNYVQKLGHHVVLIERTFDEGLVIMSREVKSLWLKERVGSTADCHEDVTATVFNLLKPSGNFTYHQV